MQRKQPEKEWPWSALATVRRCDGHENALLGFPAGKAIVGYSRSCHSPWMGVWFLSATGQEQHWGVWPQREHGGASRLRIPLVITLRTWEASPSAWPLFRWHYSNIPFLYMALLASWYGKPCPPSHFLLLVPWHFENCRILCRPISTLSKALHEETWPNLSRTPSNIGCVSKMTPAQQCRPDKAQYHWEHSLFPLANIWGHALS